MTGKERQSKDTEELLQVSKIKWKLRNYFRKKESWKKIELEKATETCEQ